MKKYQIYGVGAALVDTEVVVSDAFLKKNGIEKGVMTLVDELRQAELLDAFTADQHHLMKKSGGSACNTVVAAASLGAKAFFSGKVAADDDGEHFVGDLAESGVAFHAASPEVGVTGKCLVMVTDDAERTMNTYLGASEQLTGREIDEAALVESEWLYIEGYLLTDETRAALIRDVVAKAKESGVKVALSLSDPFVAQIFADNLRAVIGEGVDLVFCNKDEALAFTQTETVGEACDALKQNAKTFAVTDGAQGAIVVDGKDTVSVPCVPVDAVDTNGAGDMFAGAFMYALTAGRDFKWAAELANESAARVVGQFGPRLDSIEFDSIKAKFGI
jgi:sugar/nucleoside kinase (ribokinase family)